MIEITRQGIELIKSFEGLKLKAYKDIKGVLTIGYGHTGKDVFDGQKITLEEADEFLQSDIENIKKQLNKLIKVDLNNNQYSALICLVYNIGIGNFSKSTLLKLINQGDFDKVDIEFLKWCKITKDNKKVKVKGLENRRIKELELFKLKETSKEENKEENKENKTSNYLDDINDNLNKATIILNKFTLFIEVLKTCYKKIFALIFIQVFTYLEGKASKIIKFLIDYNLYLYIILIIIIIYIIIYYIKKRKN